MYMYANVIIWTFGRSKTYLGISDRYTKLNYLYLSHHFYSGSCYTRVYFFSNRERFRKKQMNKRDWISNVWIYIYLSYCLLWQSGFRVSFIMFSCSAGFTKRVLKHGTLLARGEGHLPVKLFLHDGFLLMWPK